MATDNNTRTTAQTTQENQESKEDQESQENDTDIDPAVLTCQRRAFAGIRRARDDERTSLGTRDRRGEVV